MTGASSGIGRATAVLLSQLGAKLLITGRHSERLATTLNCLEGVGHAQSVFDLCELQRIPEWLKAAAADHGVFDGLVHCAGIRVTAPLRALSLAKAEDMMRANFLAALMLAKAYCQKGCRAAGGSIVLLSSAAATAGAPAISGYAASKAAVEGLVRSLAVELARDGIRVNCIAPGLVKTEMAEEIWSMLTPEQLQELERAHPLGFGEPRDVAYAAAFLLADAGRWITGTTLVVDGGYLAQ
ncbi:MAG: SDR family oxidoreductase [Bryobacteraceae bacterium]|nr:SDR family oxidoreductase [Bryobacteraceae bacterium]